MTAVIVENDESLPLDKDDVNGMRAFMVELGGRGITRCASLIEGWLRDNRNGRPKTVGART